MASHLSRGGGWLLAEISGLRAQGLGETNVCSGLVTVFGVWGLAFRV